MSVDPDDLDRPQVRKLMAEHHETMLQQSPLEADHGLDVEGLRDPDQTTWTVWREGMLLGSGTLSGLPDGSGELVSMRTTPGFRGQGVATFILSQLLAEARERGLTRVNVQTGVQDTFEAARNLYAKNGFVACEPFGDYVADDNSVFLTLGLGD